MQDFLSQLFFFFYLAGGGKKILGGVAAEIETKMMATWTELYTNLKQAPMK